MGATTFAPQAARGPTPDSSGKPTDLFELITERARTRGGSRYLQKARSNRALSFAGLAAAVQRWDTWMRKHGVTRGDRVGIVISDPLDFAAVFLATIAHGCWALPLDAGAPGRVLEGAISRLSPSIVVGDVVGPDGCAVPWLKLPPMEEWPTDVHQDGLMKDRSSPGEGGVVLMSSGSTGRPKIINLSQPQLLHTATSVAGHHRLSATDVGFSSLPLFHVNAEVVGLLATLVAGAGLVVDDRFHRRQFWRVMADHHVTWINAVPAIVARLADPDGDEEIPDGIRFIRSASAPLPVATLRRFETATGISVLETYGMTESASQITANPVEGIRKPGAVGLPVGIELRVVRDDPGTSRDDLGEHPIGHVEIRGCAVGARQGARPESDDDEDGDRAAWLRTGDLGYLDEDGYLYLAGRRDDVINRGGEKMFPREIEDAIRQHAEVTGAVVVPGEDAALGQVPVAYLTIRGVADDSQAPRADAVVGQVIDNLQVALPRPRRPTVLHVVARFPTTPTGKVLRRAMRDEGCGAIVTRAYP